MHCFPDLCTLQKHVYPPEKYSRVPVLKWLLQTDITSPYNRVWWDIDQKCCHFTLRMIWTYYKKAICSLKCSSFPLQSQSPSLPNSSTGRKQLDCASKHLSQTGELSSLDSSPVLWSRASPPVPMSAPVSVPAVIPLSASVPVVSPPSVAPLGLSVSVPVLPVSPTLSLPLPSSASSTTTSSSSPFLHRTDPEVNGLPERPVPATEPQLSGLFLPSLPSAEPPGDPSFEGPFLFKVHKHLLLVHYQLVGVPAGPDNRPLLLVFDEGVSFGEARDDVPDQPQPLDVSVLGEDQVEFFLCCLGVQTGHKQGQQWVSHNTFVGLIAGTHSPPHRPIMGLHVRAVDAASFQRVVHLRYRTPVNHFYLKRGHGRLLQYTSFSDKFCAVFFTTQIANSYRSPFFSIKSFSSFGLLQLNALTKTRASTKTFRGETSTTMVI